MIPGFIKSKDVYQVLNAGYRAGQNVILHGPGGYGKSEMALTFLKECVGAKEEEIIVKSLSIGTSVDDLFGGINIKILQEEGRIEYNLEYSVFSKKFLILEEAFDAPVRVLESMKDVLTSGYVRNGSQIYKINTRFIIVCTNRSADEIAEDESSAALMERFPLRCKVYWERHNLEDYKELCEKVLGNFPKPIEAILKYVLSSIEDTDIAPPAPRTVIRAVKVLNAAGVDALQYMSGIPNIEKAVANFNHMLYMIEREEQYRSLLKEALILVNKAENEGFTSEEVRKLRFIKENLIKHKSAEYYDDHLVNKYTQL